MTTIRVTKKDIKQGQVGTASACPVALAIRRYLGPKGYRNPLVGDDLMIKSPTDGAFSWTYYDLPDEVRKWISTYDSGDEVKPITFKLDLRNRKGE